MRLIVSCFLHFFFAKCTCLQTDLNERRSRRDMSPQGQKRATAMVARDYRTVSGIGQSYHNNNQTIMVSCSLNEHFAEIFHIHKCTYTFYSTLLVLQNMPFFIRRDLTEQQKIKSLFSLCPPLSSLIIIIIILETIIVVDN